MRLNGPAPVTPMPPATRSDDPIEWVFFEERGSGRGDGGWAQTTLESWVDNDGRAMLSDGRMAYNGDPGKSEAVYESLPWFVRDGVDPSAALEGSRRGAAELFAALDGAVGGLERFRVVPGSRPPRDADQLDLWMRHASGASVRYIVPIDLMTPALAQARQAALAFANHLRRSYEAQDPSDVEQVASA